MAVTADKPAPYAPASAIKDVIDRYRNRGLTTPINAVVLGRAGISDSLIPRVLQALVTFDLIDESGMPTPILEGLRVAAEADFQPMLAQWLKATYADVFAFVDPTHDDETRVRDAFRNYQPIGQQSRMVTLFQGLCAAAGLMPEKPSTPRQSSSPRPRAAVVSARGSTSKNPPKNPPPLNSGSNLPPALAGMMASLPAKNVGWTKEDRDKWVNAFQVVLDLDIPIFTDQQMLDRMLE